MPNVWNSSIVTSIGIPWEQSLSKFVLAQDIRRSPPGTDQLLLIVSLWSIMVVAVSWWSIVIGPCRPFCPFWGHWVPLSVRGPPGTLGDYLDSGQDPKCHFWYGATQVFTHTDKQASKSILENIKADKDCDYNVNSGSPSNERGHA